MNFPLNPLMLVFVNFGLLSQAWAIQSFEFNVDRDVVLKHALPLYLQHKIGSVSIQGSVQDRLRISLKMRVLAESQVEADREFKKLDLISLETRDRFEVRVGHIQGVDLVSKMRDQSRNTVQVDLEIKAPYQSDLTLILGEGRNLKIDQWRGGISVSGKRDFLSFSRLELNKEFSLNCSACETEIRDSKFRGRIAVGSKPVVFSGVVSQGIHVDGLNEEVRIERSTGEFSVYTKAGRLTASNFKGKIQFQSEEGGAFLNQSSGGADIQTQSGQVILDMEEVTLPIHVDTEKSDIQIGLQPQFEGVIDLKSLKGDVIVQFPFEASKSMTVNRYGPSSPGRVDGVIGKHSDLLIHAYSKQGGVRLIRKVPSR